MKSAFGGMGERLVKFLIFMLFIGLLKHVADHIVRVCLEDELKDFGLYEFDYADFVLRHIINFFAVMMLEPIASRIASDEAIGQKKVVATRIRIAHVISFYGSIIAAAAVVLLQFAGHMEVVPKELFSPLKHKRFCDADSPYMCLWVHLLIRFFALPFRVVVVACAFPVFLGIHRVDLILWVFSIQSVLWVAGVLLSLYVFKIGLLGVAVSDLIASVAAYYMYKRALRSHRLKAALAEITSQDKENCSPPCRFCFFWCRGDDHLYNEVRSEMWEDSLVMGLRACILLFIDATVTLIFDADSEKWKWTVNSAFEVIRRLRNVPGVCGRALGCSIIVVACKYLNEIYRVYNPYDFQTLAEKLPTAGFFMGLLASVISILLAPYMLGEELADAAGMTSWLGMILFLATETTTIVLKVYESLLFASLDFRFLLNATIVSSIPFILCVGAAFYEFHYSPFLWASLWTFSALRLFMTRRRILTVILPRLTEEASTIDEFDQLLRDDGDDEDALLLQTMRY